MRRCLVSLLIVLLLSGCGKQEVFEQVEDVYQVMAPQAGVVKMEIPDDAAATAMGTGADHAVYFCDGYSLTVQTLAGGDLSRTVIELTGFSPEMMTLLQTGNGELKRYEGTWTCAGEGGDQVGRLVLLDDGTYHYAVTVMAPAESVGELLLAWDTVLGSVKLDRTDS